MRPGQLIAGLPEIIYAVGGTSRSGAHRLDEWHSYSTALVLRINTRTGEAGKVVEYVSPPDVCADDQPSISFKAATLEDGLLYCCTQTEVIVYSVPEFTVRHYITHPWFNDLHHVRPFGKDRILVANTGLDMVMELTLDGEVTRSWYMFDDDPWKRFSKDIDYRKIATTKPHKSHPNFTIIADGEIWATRFFQKDMMCLTRNRETYKLGDHGLHDGVGQAGAFYLTSVDGCLHIVDEAMNAHKTIDLNQAYSHNEILGWCRGVMPVEPNMALVAFTAIRGTAFSENLEWTKRRVRRILHGKGVLQTISTYKSRITLFDLENKIALWEMDLGEHDLHAIYSIH